MKRIVLAFSVVLLAAAAGCLDSQEGFFHVDFIVDYDVPESTIPGDPILSTLPPQSLPEIPIVMNNDSDFSTQNFDYLVAVELRHLRFVITANSTDPVIDLLEPVTPTPDDWSFLESVEIWFRNPDTLEEGLAAYVPEGDPQLDPGNDDLQFICLDIDLLDFFDDDYNTILVIKAVGTTPPDDVIFAMESRFRIVAAIIQ